MQNIDGEGANGIMTRKGDENEVCYSKRVG